VIYSATISSTPLRLRESRIVADLVLRGVSEEGWSEAVYEQNVLQVDSAVAVRRSAKILRARLEPLGEGLWRMVRDGDREQSLQAAFAGVVRDSRLLGDFMDLTVREQRGTFSRSLAPRMWSEYLEGCRGRDPEMPLWSEKTRVKLRSVVFSILAEVGYLKDTRSLLLQNVFVDRELSNYLKDRGETYVLRCLEVAG